MRTQVLAAMLLGGAGWLLAQASHAGPRPGTLVHVGGDVASPGWAALPTPSLYAALAQAGGEGAAATDELLHHGDTVWVEHGRVSVRPSAGALPLGLPIDVNRADAATLQTLPGVGPGRAADILRERREGEFAHPRDLQRAHGIGPATVAALTPYITTGR